MRQFELLFGGTIGGGAIELHGASEIGGPVMSSGAIPFSKIETDGVYLQRRLQSMFDLYVPNQDAYVPIPAVIVEPLQRDADVRRGWTLTVPGTIWVPSGRNGFGNGLTGWVPTVSVVYLGWVAP